MIKQKRKDIDRFKIMVQIFRINARQPWDDCRYFDGMTCQ